MRWSDALVGFVTVSCLFGGLWVIKPFLPFLLKIINPQASSYSATSGTTANSGYFTLENAFASFSHYPVQVIREANSYKRKLNSLRGAHRRLAREVGYAEKIATFERAGKENALLTRGICGLALHDFPHLQGPAPSTSSPWSSFVQALSRSTTSGQAPEISRVKESLKHLVRDWSIEGEAERRVIYQPILEELERVPVSKRSTHKVLIPGSGLGRLGWEIARMGFDTTTIELSYFMSLTLRYLLSPATTHKEQFTVYPYIHWWSHQRSSANTFRGIKVPDTLPRPRDNWSVVEGDFLELGLDGEDGGYDTIVTLYFIDTASNLISYLSHIHYLLKPNGKWVNLGPLLYSGATLELSLEETIKLAEQMGFDFTPLHSDNEVSKPVNGLISHSRHGSVQNEHSGSSSKSRHGSVPNSPTGSLYKEASYVKSRTVPSEYTADQNAMMKWVYQAEFWVARKRVEEEVIML